MAAISADAPADSRRLIQRLGLRFPLLSDPQLSRVAAYGVAMEGRDIAVPAVYVVDRAGTIRWRHVGESMTDRPSVAEILRHLPAGAPRPPSAR